MGGLIILGIIIVAFVVIDTFGVALGVDSRVDFEDPRAPARGLTT